MIVIPKYLYEKVLIDCINDLIYTEKVKIDFRKRYPE